MINKSNIDWEFVSWQCFIQAEWNMMLKWLTDYTVLDRPANI